MRISCSAARILCVFGFVWLASCQNNSQRLIQYGAGQEFALRNDESEVQVSRERVTFYESLCLDSTISLPVNKAVASNAHTLFICFADSELTVQKYVAALRRDPARRIVDERQATLHDSAAHVLFFRSHEMFVCEYWTASRLPGMQEIFVLVCSDSTHAASLYRDDNDFNQRFRH